MEEADAAISREPADAEQADIAEDKFNANSEYAEQPEQIDALRRELGQVKEQAQLYLKSSNTYEQECDAAREAQRKAELLNEQTICAYCGESFVRDAEGCLDAIQAPDASSRSRPRPPMLPLGAG